MFEVICLSYMLPVESSARPGNLDFSFFLSSVTSVRCGESNGTLDLSLTLFVYITVLSHRDSKFPMIGNFRKLSATFRNFWKLSETFGNFRKLVETLEVTETSEVSNHSETFGNFGNIRNF